MGAGFVPFRRNVIFVPSHEVSILPLIGDRSFIQDTTHWGAPFRFGVLRIPENDFWLIAGKMVGDLNLLK